MLVGISAAVEVEIFDLTGRRLRRLEEQRSVSAGTYSIAWDGRDEAGVVFPRACTPREFVSIPTRKERRSSAGTFCVL